MRKWTKKGIEKCGLAYGGAVAYLDDVYKYIRKKKGADAERIIDPLERYLKAGMANYWDCQRLFKVRPYMVGRILIEREGQPLASVMDAISEKLR